MAVRLLLALALLAGAAIGQCNLQAPATGLHLGPTDGTRLRSTGDVKMIFLFVDFPDAPASESASQLYQSLVPFAQSWFGEVSYGRMSLNVTPVFQWFRMPRASTTYNFARGLTFALHKQYIADAVAAANVSVDFSQYDGAYILASQNSDIPFSPTFVPNPGDGVNVDGVNLRHVVTLGADVRLAIPVYRWHVIQHETGHLMGLPDLYLFSGSDVHAPVGAWDNMGLITLGSHFTAWQKRKLGWLTPTEFTCLNSNSAPVTLSPLEIGAGVRGVAVQLSPTKALVAELRRRTGQDARLCDEGLLVYTVDSSVASGSGPLVVQRAAAATDQALLTECGSGYNATFNLGGAKPTAFRDAATGVTFEIRSVTAENGLSVQVTNPLSGLRFVPVTPCRVVDTREASFGVFGTPFLAGGTVRSFAVPQKPGCNIPANAAAYSVNVTVVPREPLGYLTIFPTGQAQPFVSTLNSLDGRIKANAAIVPAGTGGAVSVYANNGTELILDINGYFIDAALHAQALAFYPVTPCRVLDTRTSHAPILAAGVGRNFSVVASNCGVPANAQAYSVNATVVPPAALGFLTLWPTGQAQPFVSTLNAPTGAITANAAIVPAGTNGQIGAFASSDSHLVLDINGYFAPAGAANAQRFFTAAPCRLLDTRNPAGEFGGPVLDGGSVRSYRLPLANCGLPGGAAAFSLNATVVPASSLGFLTLWPSGTAQPLVSTLNALDGSITSNAAIVPAGTAGAVASFVTNQTHLILDTNGYFAP